MVGEPKTEEEGEPEAPGRWPSCLVGCWAECTFWRLQGPGCRLNKKIKEQRTQMPPKNGRIEMKILATWN